MYNPAIVDLLDFREDDQPASPEKHFQPHLGWENHSNGYCLRNFSKASDTVLHKILVDKLLI